jgi:hypothetical protein
MLNINIGGIMFKSLVYLGLIFILAGCASTEENNNQSQSTAGSVTIEESTESGEDTAVSEGSEDIGYRFVENTEFMEQAQASEDAIREEWEADTYTADSPLVKLDPYNIAPLSALVLFETENPTRVTYSVASKTEETTLTNTIDEPNTVHEIPMLGLYPGHNNTVHFELVNEEGNTTEHQIQIETEEIPEGFYELELVESQPEKCNMGLLS